MEPPERTALVPVDQWVSLAKTSVLLGFLSPTGLVILACCLPPVRAHWTDVALGLAAAAAIGQVALSLFVFTTIGSGLILQGLLAQFSDRWRPTSREHLVGWTWMAAVAMLGCYLFGDFSVAAGFAALIVSCSTVGAVAWGILYARWRASR